MRLISPLLTKPSPSTLTSSSTTPLSTAMIILNSPISHPPSPVFQHLWNGSQFHICADGGANRLKDATTNNDQLDNNKKDARNISNFFSESESDSNANVNSDSNASPTRRCNPSFIPEVIRGDLDSLRKDTRMYYESIQHPSTVAIEQDPDQDTNDLDKCIQRILSTNEKEIEKATTAATESTESSKHFSSSSSSSTSFDQLVIYGAFGGRFDQEMASFQALYKWAEAFENRIWLYSDETSAVLIPSKKTVEVQIPHQEEGQVRTASTTSDSSTIINKIQEGPTCGLIPLGSPCESLTTTGLKWNLQQSVSSFGAKDAMVSTSNHIVDDIVTIHASHPIIFTAEIQFKA